MESYRETDSFFYDLIFSGERMRILLLDNYDSFTYNVLHLLRSIEGVEVTVKKNDEVALDEIEGYDKVIFSPGPGVPAEAGAMLEIIRQYGATKSMLGICLGHQAIAEVYGARLCNLPEVYHGVASIATQSAKHYLFDGLSNQIQIGRYHSWAVLPDSLPSDLLPTMFTEDGCLMAFRHVNYDLHGVQFHPESILTPQGEQIIRNFLKGEVLSPFENA